MSDDYTSSPEQADKLRSRLFDQTAISVPTAKIKIQKIYQFVEMRNLKQRIYDIDKKRSLTLIDE